MKTRRPRTPEVCPVCGEDVPPRALACPECGADERAGWSDDTSGGLDLPADDFDYEAFLKDEFGEGPSRPRRHAVWWGTLALLLIALLWYFLGG